MSAFLLRHLSTSSNQFFFTQTTSRSLRAALPFYVISSSSSSSSSPSSNSAGRTSYSLGCYIKKVILPSIQNIHSPISKKLAKTVPVTSLNPRTATGTGLYITFLKLNLNSNSMNIPDLDEHDPLGHIDLIKPQADQPHPAAPSEMHLEQFRDNIQISKEKMVELVDRGIFAQQAQEFNRKAVELAYEGYIQEAAILLGQAQKILEYAANRGKEISRSLIVTVLHNEAFCHQQSWQLERCSNYIQALIYNLNCQIKQGQNGEEGLIMTDSMKHRSQLTHYYLLYCAINSQLKRNDGALVAAKRANSLLKANSSVLYTLATKSRLQLNQDTLFLIKQLKDLQFCTQNVSVDHLLEAVVRFYQIWKNKCKFPNHQLRNFVKKMSNFSIGNIMQMEPLQYSQSRPFALDLSYEHMLERVINISISYFTMATELRILAFKSSSSKEEGEKTSEYRQSQCYHLFSILLFLHYLPFEMAYLRHIMSSFKTHYHIDIYEQLPSHDSKQTPEEHFYSLLFSRDQEDQIKNSTAGNSEKGNSSGRNSFHDGRQSYLNKLESYVRESLKKQHFQRNKDLAKLNNYYYVRGQLEQSKQKVVKKGSNRSSLKSNTKRSCLTSKHSANKTPINFKSIEGSPKKSKCSSRSSKLRSKIGSIDQTMLGKWKKSPVMQQYFEPQKSQRKKPKKIRPKSKKRSSNSKQNNDYLTFAKPRHVASPEHNSWKAKNITNRQGTTCFQIRQNADLHTVKSTSRSKSKAFQAKKKAVYYK